MEHDLLKKDLLNTLYIMKVKEFPVLIEEVLHYFVSQNKTPVNNPLVATKLKELESEGLVYINSEGYISLDKNVSDRVRDRMVLEEITKQKAKHAQKVLKGLMKNPFVRFVGGIGDGPLGRIAKDEKIKLILVVEKETSYLARWWLKNYLKFRFSYRHFHIERVFEFPHLKWSGAGPDSGIKLLNLLVLVNKDKTFENFMAANNWIFEIFSNYPLEKVSWGFRVSKDGGKDVSGIYKSINRFLTPKSQKNN